MKLNTIALATAFALTSSFALAQTGGAGSGTPVPEKSGAGTTMGTTNNAAPRNGTMTKGTTGMSRSGAGTAPEAMTPGSTDESKPGGRSTARTPAGD